MGFERTFQVSNPTHLERSDYVEVDLARTELQVPADLPDDKLALYRMRSGELAERVEIQVDYPFGRPMPGSRPACATSLRGQRVMTFLSQNTPAGTTGGVVQEYTPRTSHTYYRLVAEEKTAVGAKHPNLGVLHYLAAGDSTPDFLPARPVEGVKLWNAAPGEHGELKGLDLYISLVPSPLPSAPVNYSGAVTSVTHQRARAGRAMFDHLSPMFIPEFYETDLGRARWGQVIKLDFYATAWDRQWYTTVDLLTNPETNHGRRYELVWSNVGPHRAVVTLASERFTLSFRVRPVIDQEDVKLTARLFRVISLYPGQEYYSEQLLVRPDEYPELSLAFRAHYLSHLDLPRLQEAKLEFARNELAPDYWAAWWDDGNKFVSPHQLNLGYAFASDSHARSLSLWNGDIYWRLQLGHEHRCVHGFLYEPHDRFGKLHTVAHDMWYLRLFKPLEVYPFTRYLPGPKG